jgi:hypothetical protein
MQNLRSFCEITEGLSKDLKIDFTSSIFVFYLAFERQFSDLPFSRSIEHKIETLNAYVEKRRRKKKKTRAGLLKCYASHRIKKEENSRRAT